MDRLDEEQRTFLEFVALFGERAYVNMVALTIFSGLLPHERGCPGMCRKAYY